VRALAKRLSSAPLCAGMLESVSCPPLHCRTAVAFGWPMAAAVMSLHRLLRRDWPSCQARAFVTFSGLHVTHRKHNRASLCLVKPSFPHNLGACDGIGSFAGASPSSAARGRALATKSCPASLPTGGRTIYRGSGCRRIWLLAFGRRPPAQALIGLNPSPRRSGRLVARGDEDVALTLSGVG